MEKITIVVNTGSASKKYAIYRGGTKPEALFRCEHNGNNFVMSITYNNNTYERNLSLEEYENAFSYIVHEARSIGFVIDSLCVVIGIRVVAPGTFFTKHRFIDLEYQMKLENAEKIAPLHIRPVLDEIAQIVKVLPDARMAGVSDSAFHSTMPTRARIYGLPKNEAQDLDIYRFGYHGLSTSMAIHSLLEIESTIQQRIIICHLGGGSSITACENGLSIDTSMGFTPLEGIIGGTRIGDIDAGVILHLMENSKSPLIQHLNMQSGLLGVSGQSADIRVLFDLEARGNIDAKNALDLYVYQIQKHIGAYIAVLGGIDALIFTGTVGERSSIMRERICSSLHHLGITIDIEKNNKTIEKFGYIDNVAKNNARIIVIPSREMDMIAIETNKQFISIAIS